MCKDYIGVYILDVPYHADCIYTYSVPCDLQEDIEKGTAVVVPFGQSNRKKSAIVISTDMDVAGDIKGIKPVLSVLSGYFCLNEEMIELCSFMKNQTLCTFGDAVRCVIPSFAIAKTREIFTASGKMDKPNALYEYIRDNPSVDIKRLTSRFENPLPELRRLIRNGFVSKDTVVEEKDNNRYETRAFLNIDKEEALRILDGEGVVKLRGKKQEEILRLLCEYGELSDKEIYQMASTLKTSLDALIKKELVGIRKVELSSPQFVVDKRKESVTLSPEQEQAFSALKELFHDSSPRAALLYGVTGSGKTSVIKKMIDEAIDSKRGVIILVPEISLTPQTVDTFCGYYGERVAVVHSNLSNTERFEAYKRIIKGEADIVIGTRSAVFAPVKNLGMIVIDEEQEHTYKSDTSPKYLAHDIARFRCAKAGALMLLASATPSLNSYYKAKSGKYALVKMTKRYGNATLPDVIITDMRKERARGNMSAFGTKLAEYMSRTLDDDRQAILFLNRRGYHSSVSCKSCGKAIECPSCSVAMTYHSYRKISEELDAENTRDVMVKSGVLKCHYCGYRIPVPTKCQHCNEEGFEYVGFGTQKTEQDLTKLFPHIKTLRLDADTTTTKSSYEEILGAFRNKEAQALIGTQMVTKGHNFPLVTLVGVVMADTMLYTSDYRSSERTFSMLTQVIGRAGRAKDKGVSIIQTNSPNDQTILLSAKQDYESFYENEIQVRKAYEFPPFCDIAVLTLSSVNEAELGKNSEKLIKRLEQELKGIGAPVKAYGPFEAPIYKSNGRYRKRILLKCVLNSSIRQALSKIYIEFTRASDKNLLSIDFNPSSI